MKIGVYVYILFLLYCFRKFVGQPLSITNLEEKIFNRVKNQYVEQPTEESLRGLDIPRYMQDLYESLSSHEKSEDLLHHGNVARSYTDLNLDPEPLSRNHYYIFNVSDIDNSREVLKKAELRLFKGKNKNSKHRDLTRVLQMDVINLSNNKTVSSKIISSKSYGWQVFPLTEIVQNWIDNRTHNKGLKISIRTLYGANTLLDFEADKSLQHRSILVTYTKEKKELSLSSLLKQFGPHPNSIKTNNLAKRIRRTVNDNIKKCGVEPLVVPLELIDWHKLFRYPTQFTINQCKGQCYHKNDEDYLGQTSHSILQALFAGVVQDDNVNYPCCAPTKFLPGPAILIDHSSGIQVIKVVRLENLTVTECECL